MRLIEANHGERRSGGGEFDGFMVHGGGRCKQHAVRGKKTNSNGGEAELIKRTEEPAAARERLRWRRLPKPQPSAQ